MIFVRGDEARNVLRQREESFGMPSTMIVAQELVVLDEIHALWRGAGRSVRSGLRRPGARGADRSTRDRCGDWRTAGVAGHDLGPFAAIRFPDERSLWFAPRAVDEALAWIDLAALVRTLAAW